MADSRELTLQGHGGAIVAREWPNDQARFVVLLCHGYGEHIGRYEYVADRLVREGAAVYGQDHVGHGRSDGERVLIEDYDKVVDDFHLLEERARKEHPGLPVVLVGHSMGGMIAARYGQRFGDGLEAIVLSAPVLGEWAAMDGLLSAPEIPDVPIDPSTLSRDPAVGEAYVADPLVWHGPFKRATLVAIRDTMATIRDDGPIDGTPVLWLHGTDDGLVPYAGSETGWKALAGDRSEAKTYEGARHEIFNETNKDEVLDDVVAFLHEHTV